MFIYVFKKHGLNNETFFGGVGVDGQKRRQKKILTTMAIEQWREKFIYF